MTLSLSFQDVRVESLAANKGYYISARDTLDKNLFFLQKRSNNPEFFMTLWYPGIAMIEDLCIYESREEANKVATDWISNRG